METLSILMDQLDLQKLNTLAVRVSAYRDPLYHTATEKRILSELEAADFTKALSVPGADPVAVLLLALCRKADPEE